MTYTNHKISVDTHLLGRAVLTGFSVGREVLTGFKDLNGRRVGLIGLLIQDNIKLNNMYKI